MKLTLPWTAKQVRTWAGILFAPEDRMALVFLRGRQVQQQVSRATVLPRMEFLKYLRHRNAQGWNLFGMANPLRSDATGRTKSDVIEARSLYLDIDQETSEVLQRLHDELPPPNLVIRTSPGRRQVIWRLAEPLSVAEAERTLRSLALAYKTDRAATDAARVLRLPGFVNHKYPDLLLGRRIVHLMQARHQRVSIGAFRSVPVKAEPPQPEAVLLPGEARQGIPPEIASQEDLRRAWSGRNPRHWKRPASASERDVYLANRLLRAGVPQQRLASILAGCPNRIAGRQKTDMRDYLRRTIQAALPLGTEAAEGAAPFS